MLSSVFFSTILMRNWLSSATLTDFGPGRYQDMNQVIRKLEEIERYADTIVPFVISSQVNRPPVLLGREKDYAVDIRMPAHIMQIPLLLFICREALGTGEPVYPAGFSDTIVPFVISSQVNRPPVLLGREKELQAMEQWLNRDGTNCLFLTGMGGMGKSTLVRGYIADHRSRVRLPVEIVHHKEDSPPCRQIPEHP